MNQPGLEGDSRQRSQASSELFSRQTPAVSQERPWATPLSSQKESREPMGVGGVSLGRAGSGGVGGGEGNVQVEMSGCREGGEARWVRRGPGSSCR